MPLPMVLSCGLNDWKFPKFLGWTFSQVKLEKFGEFGGREWVSSVSSQSFLNNPFLLLNGVLEIQSFLCHL